MKRGRGQWEVVFTRRRERPTKAKLAKAESQSNDLIMGLTRREIGPAMAAELVEKHSAETIHKMAALFDWYAASGQAKGPGFLVDSIRNPEKYRLPREFVEQRQQNQRPERLIKSRREIVARQSTTGLDVTQQSRDKAFQAFWKGLGPDRRYEFETAAVQGASTLKRDGYRRLKSEGGPAFEEYRQMILRDHFENSHLVKARLAECRSA